VEIAAVKTDNGWRFESTTSRLAAVDGACRAEQSTSCVCTTSAGQNDSNQRYTTSPLIYAQMIGPAGR